MIEYCEDWHLNIWNPDTEPLPDTPQVHRRISLCTTCMGRLRDLMVTLPVNMQHNRDYPNVEFVVLNYNSPDKMDDWMHDYMMPYIESGRLVYVRTTEPEFFSMAHSRNVAFKVATGDIVMNVDADNLMNGPGFAEMLNRLAELRPTKALFSVRSLAGQVGLYREEWLELGGYDETFQGYGTDDIDMFYRALAAGCKLMAWDRWRKQYYECMPTSNEDKMRYLECKHLLLTGELNKRIALKNLRQKKLIANQGKPWGRAVLVKNFTESLQI